MRRFAVSLPFLALLAAVACSRNRSDSQSASPSGGPDGSTAPSSTTTPEPTASSDASPAPTTPPPPPPPKVDVTNETIDVNGEKRQYVLAVPKDYDAAKHYPLVLVYHGDYGSGPSMRAIHTFDNESGSDAIVAYPTGATDPAWNLELSNTNRDFVFLQQLVTALEAKYTIDAARIFATGYSSGGFFINFAVCQLGMFRALSVYAGGAPYTNDPNNPVPKCASDKLVAISVFHGDKDGTVPLSSGQWDAQYWAGRNGCQTSGNEPSLDIQPSPCKAYSGCPTDKPVQLCVIPGLGHFPWSNGAHTTWEFFKSLP